MSQDYNRVILKGHLGKAPEQRDFSDGGKVVTFQLATAETWKDKNSGERKERTQWHQIAIFDEAKAEVAMRYLKKGSTVLLEGQIETRKWEKDGENRYATEVVIRPYSGLLSLQDNAPKNG
jgi:single-strand DNA-binding protein